MFLVALAFSSLLALDAGPSEALLAAVPAARAIHVPSATVHTIESGVPGPTVLVVGGLDNNQPVGSMAAEAIAGWQIVRGRLIVVVWSEAIADETDVDAAPVLSDVDAADDEVDGPLWNLVREVAPDYLIDLHEGDDFAQVAPRSFGNSILTDATPESFARAARMAAALNSTTTDERLRFVVKENAIRGSFARAAHDLLKVPSMVLETTTRGQAEAFRARQHRILVATFLTGIGMLEHGPDVLIGTAAQAGDLRVALYASSGAEADGSLKLERILEQSGGAIVRRVCASDVRAGVLEQFDVVVFPGGSASSQSNAIGPDGRAAVRRFVEDGGGYLGICAGAYLASSEYDWALQLLDADIVDRDHWARGVGDVLIEPTALGAALLSAAREPFEVHYSNGPIFERARSESLPNFRVLAWFRSEVEKVGVPGGVMRGTPAIVMARFGAGRVVCSSPHPESTPGLEHLALALVKLAAER